MSLIGTVPETSAEGMEDEEPKDEPSFSSAEKEFSSERIASKLLAGSFLSGNYQSENASRNQEDRETSMEPFFTGDSSQTDAYFGDTLPLSAVADAAPFSTSDEAFRLEAMEAEMDDLSAFSDVEPAQNFDPAILKTKISSVRERRLRVAADGQEVLTKVDVMDSFIPESVPDVPGAVNCALCSVPVAKPDLWEGYFCEDCYSKIFVEMDSPSSPLPQHKSLAAYPANVRKIADNVWRQRGAENRTNRDGITGTKYRTAADADVDFWNEVASMTAGDFGSEESDGSFRADSPTSVMPSRSTGGDYPPNPPAAGSGNGGNRRDEWVVNASDRSLRTINPIRNLVQGIDVKPNPAKDLIKLSVGDPTLYGNLKISQKAVDKFCEVLQKRQHNGYSMSMGSLEARTAVAERYALPDAPLTADDVVLTSGTSGALEIAIGALANEGDNILLPRPGFPLFRTIADSFGVECRYYNLLPNDGWEIDLPHLASLADARTAAVVVNNPSNPCGSVYSASHLQALLRTASDLHLPIIADEVYADMAFAGRPFVPLASQPSSVPVLSVGGVSKQFVVPGWRLGWITIHDSGDVLTRGGVRTGIRQLTTRMLVPNTPAQAVVPTLLEAGVDDTGLRAVMQELEDNATFTVQALAKAPGVRCIEPQGSMYTMVEVDVKMLGFDDDMHFTKKLLEEEAVFVLPGQCFQAPNFVRVVFCAPKVVLSEAFHRIRSFCSRHAGVM